MKDVSTRIHGTLVDPKTRPLSSLAYSSSMAGDLTNAALDLVVGRVHRTRATFRIWYVVHTLMSREVKDDCQDLDMLSNSSLQGGKQTRLHQHGCSVHFVVYFTIICRGVSDLEELFIIL